VSGRYEPGARVLIQSNPHEAAAAGVVGVVTKVSVRHRAERRLAPATRACQSASTPTSLAQLEGRSSSTSDAG